MVSADRGPEGRGRGVPQGIVRAVFSREGSLTVVTPAKTRMESLVPVVAQIYRDGKPRDPVVQIISMKGNTIGTDGTVPSRIK